MRVDEAEGPVSRQRDALTGRRQGDCYPVRSADAKRRGLCNHRIQIEMALGHHGKTIDQRGEIGMLAGLHQAEMPFRQSERRLARHRAEHRNAERGDGIGDQRAMLLACCAVENDAGDMHRGVMRGETPDDGGRRLRLSRDIEHQHDGKPKMRGKIGASAAAARDAAGAVEQAHHAFDDEDIGLVGGSRRQSVEQRGRHGP